MTYPIGSRSLSSPSHQSILTYTFERSSSSIWAPSYGIVHTSPWTVTVSVFSSVSSSSLSSTGSSSDSTVVQAVMVWNSSSLMYSTKVTVEEEEVAVEIRIRVLLMVRLLLRGGGASPALLSSVSEDAAIAVPSSLLLSDWMVTSTGSWTSTKRTELKPCDPCLLTPLVLAVLQFPKRPQIIIVFTNFQYFHMFLFYRRPLVHLPWSRNSLKKNYTTTLAKLWIG